MKGGEGEGQFDPSEIIRGHRGQISGGSPLVAGLELKQLEEV